MRHLHRVLAGMGMCCSVCLMPMQTAQAQTCLGVSTEIVAQPIQQDCGGEPCPPFDCTAELGLDVCRLYADFDAEFPVHLFSVGNVDITTTDPEGFFQHPFSSPPTSPTCFLIPVFPDMICDSFITINYECAPSPPASDDTAVDGEFDPNEFQNNGHVVGGWFNANPPSSQGHPLPSPDPDIFRVLIAQFAVSAGEDVSGTLDVFWHVHPGSTQGTRAEFSCSLPCPADFDGSGDVGAADLAQLLGSWGPCAGCPADFDNDGDVDAADLAMLLGNWGPCP